MPERTLRIDATFTTELDDYELARMCRDLDGDCPSERYASFSGVRPHCVLGSALCCTMPCRKVKAPHWADAFKRCRAQEDS